MHVAMDYFLARLARSQVEIGFEKYVLAQEISKKAKVDLSVFFF